MIFIFLNYTLKLIMLIHGLKFQVYQQMQLLNTMAMSLGYRQLFLRARVVLM